MANCGNKKMRHRLCVDSDPGRDLWKNQRAGEDTHDEKKYYNEAVFGNLVYCHHSFKKMFPAHSGPYVSFHLSAFSASSKHQPGVCEFWKPHDDLGLPGVQCWEPVLKECLQTLNEPLRKTGPATHRSWRAGILEGHCKYCLNRSSKACPMEPMTSWASPSQHSRMWQARKEGDTHSLETVPGLSGPLGKEPHLRGRGKEPHASHLVSLPTQSHLCGHPTVVTDT